MSPHLSGLFRHTDRSRQRAQVRKLMMNNRIGVYAGVDATAPSLHLGHLVAFMPLFWLYINGFGAYTVIGSSTAKIGDPTGKSKDRPNIPNSEIVQNMTSIHYQLAALWRSVERKTLNPMGLTRGWAWSRGIINNNAWWNKQPLLEIFKVLGSHMRIGPLLSRDNVKARLEDGSGMSLAEFAYPMMQGWDWWQLYKQRSVQMQIGGSDQYSNILLGAQCVKHCVRNEADFLPANAPIPEMVGLTVPLLTTSSGAKFGKSEGNAVWLDPFRTPPFDLYGYLVRRSDDEVERLLKLLTFLPQQQIAKVVEEHKQDPPKRIAQHLLAFEVVDFVHGSDVAKGAQIQHRQMYGYNRGTVPSTSSGLAPQTAEHYHHPSHIPEQEPFQPRIDMKLPRSLLKESLPYIALAAEFTESRGEADRLIKAGGMYIGGAPGQKGGDQKGMGSYNLAFTPLKTWTPDYNELYLIENKVMILRRGKHNVRCIEFIHDKEFEKLGLTFRGQKRLGRTRQALALLRELKGLVDTQEEPILKQRVEKATAALEKRSEEEVRGLVEPLRHKPVVKIPGEEPRDAPYSRKGVLIKQLRDIERIVSNDKGEVLKDEHHAPGEIKKLEKQLKGVFKETHEVKSKSSF